MNEDAQVAADARAEAIRSGCQDPEARRIVSVYAARRATPAISADDIEQEAWLDILRTLHRRHDPTVATVPKHIAGVAYNAVRTAARNLERRAGLAQEKRMGIVRVPADEVEVPRTVDAAGDRQVLLTRIGAVRDTLPTDLAEEIDRYLTGERSLGRRERRAAVQALRDALCENGCQKSYPLERKAAARGVYRRFTPVLGEIISKAGEQCAGTGKGENRNARSTRRGARAG